MAKKVITSTEFVDDLDGGTAVGTVLFSFDGTSYEIDLSKKNANAMAKALKLYVDHARKVKPAHRRATAAPKSGKKSDLSAIREWAQASGYKVSPRGRVSRTVVEAFDNRE